VQQFAVGRGATVPLLTAAKHRGFVDALIKDVGESKSQGVVDARQKLLAHEATKRLKMLAVYSRMAGSTGFDRQSVDQYHAPELHIDVDAQEEVFRNHVYPSIVGDSLLTPDRVRKRLWDAYASFSSLLGQPSVWRKMKAMWNIQNLSPIELGPKLDNISLKDLMLIADPVD